MILQKFTHKINRFALLLALFSACFGILLLIAYLVFRSDSLIEIGIFHLYPTVIIHLLMLLIVIINGINNRKDYKEHLITIGLMLLNIPLAFACFLIVVETV